MSFIISDLAIEAATLELEADRLAQDEHCGDMAVELGHHVQVAINKAIAEYKSCDSNASSKEIPVRFYDEGPKPTFYMVGDLKKVYLTFQEVWE